MVKPWKEGKKKSLQRSLKDFHFHSPKWNTTGWKTTCHTLKVPPINFDQPSWSYLWWKDNNSTSILKSECTYPYNHLINDIIILKIPRSRCLPNELASIFNCHKTPIIQVLLWVAITLQDCLSMCLTKVIIKLGIWLYLFK